MSALLGVLAVVLTGMAAGSPSIAKADLTPGQRDALVKMLTGGAGYKPPDANWDFFQPGESFTGNEWADAVLEEEWKGFPNQPSSQQMHHDLNQARRRSGLLPKLKGVLPRLSLVATAGMLGWEAGGHLSGMVLGAVNQQPDSGVRRLDGLVPLEEGDLWTTLGLDSSHAPFDGFGIEAHTGSSTIRRSQEAADEQTCHFPFDFANDYFAPGNPKGTVGDLIQVQDTGSGACGAGHPIDQMAYYTMDLLKPYENEASMPMPPTITIETPDWPGQPPSVADLDPIIDAIEAGDYPGINQLLGMVPVPSCEGMLWSACEAELIGDELVPARVELDWSEAVVTLPADAVVETSPGAGVFVDKGATVHVTTNPDEQGMPLVVPQPLPGETGEQYKQRLIEEGFTESEIAIVTVPEIMGDPAAGPEGVVSVNPQPGSRHAPGTSPQVSIRQNPDTMPAPGGGGPGWSPPGVQGIDFGPLAGLSVACDKFPFGLFCWIYEYFGGWSGGECDFDFDIPTSQGDIPVDVCIADPAVQVFRPIFLVISVFVAGWMIATAAMGGGAQKPPE